MSARRVVWRGAAVRAKVLAATQAAIDETTEAAAHAAQGSHAWRSRTGQLESEIQNERAKRLRGEVVGKFGTTQRRGFYGLFFERRRPFLRPAADMTFRLLASTIRRKL